MLFIKFSCVAAYDANVIESSLLPLYPWQLVHDGQEFLADYPVTFSYLIAHQNPPPQGKRKVKQIKVLVILSTASDKQYKSIESKQTVINQGLKKTSQEGRACLLSWYQETEKPTIKRLRAYLTERDEPLDIIHFDGHGFFKRKCPNPECPKRDTDRVFYSLNTQKCQFCGSVLEEPQGFLFFDRDSPGIDYRSGAEFARLVGQSKPMLVVITACKSALAYKSDSVFNGVAQKLLRQVPAVVATPFSISEESATNFVEQFYRALGAKKSLLEAVKLAGDAMRHHKYEWYRPVIFLRPDTDEDGNLFEWEVTSVELPPEVTPKDLSQINKNELLDILKRMIPPQFNQLLFKLDVPQYLMPSSDNPQTERAIALLSWAEAPGGCGLQKIKQALDELLK